MKINDRELVSCWLSMASWCTVIKYFIILININQPLILFFVSLDLGGCGGNGNLVETGTVSSLVGQLSRFGTVMTRCHGIMMIFTIPVHSSLLLRYYNVLIVGHKEKVSAHKRRSRGQSNWNAMIESHNNIPSNIKWRYNHYIAIVIHRHCPISSSSVLLDWDTILFIILRGEAKSVLLAVTSL